MSQPQYLSLQETKQLFEKPEYKSIVETLRYKGDDGKDCFEYDAYNPFGTGYLQEKYKVPRMNAEDAMRLAETVKTYPFTLLAKEFLAQSGTTGIGGAAYLVPVKIHSILQTYASPADIINDVSMMVLPASEIPGRTLDVDIAKRSSYYPHATASGGKAPEEELGFMKATLDFGKTLTVHFNIGNDLIEDTPQLSLMEIHIRMAGAEMGKRSTTEVLAVMASTTDGDGTLNAETAGADTTTLVDLDNACEQIIVDEFAPDTFLSPTEVLRDAIMKDATYFPAGSTSTFRETILHGGDPNAWGLKWVKCNHGSLWTEASNLPTNCISYALSKDYSYLSGRKRWLRIENYSDPIRDLIGAVITSRQDTVSIYNDSVCKISEA